MKHHLRCDFEEEESTKRGMEAELTGGTECAVTKEGRDVKEGVKN
jgi:hypothetical protein